MNFSKWLVIFVLAILVHMAKMARFHAVLFGTTISIEKNARLYCLVVPFGILLPFKLGEFLKLFLYGREIKSYSSVLIAILLDRFFDTTVLLFACAIVSFVQKISLPFVAAALFAIFLLLVLAYVFLPGICAFWKRLFLLAHASRRHNVALKIICAIEKSFFSVKKNLHGRASALFLLSVFAWGAELFCAAFLQGFSQNSWKAIFKYLDFALLSRETIFKSPFLFASVLTLWFCFLILKFFCFAKSERKK